MALVAGIDSSTQSCKVVIRDADSGALVRTGRASHPDGTEVHPDHWWTALQAAADAAGGLDDVAAVAVGGQQHGMVCLDEDGEVVRDALLWNDTRSAQAADDLIDELGQGDVEAGKAAWAQACGSAPVASLTITKLRWLATAEPDNAARVAAVCLPHDWLSWRLAGHGPKSQGGDGAINALVTDRSDASGTGYWSPVSNDYDLDLLRLGFGSTPVLPRLSAPGQALASMPSGALIGPGAGDNAAAALGLGLGQGDVAVSIGTSGVVSAISPTPIIDRSGVINGFADATGCYLPLACTLNGARIMAGMAETLGVDLARLSELALSAAPGAHGLVMVPYLEGERTPNQPYSTGSLHGLTLSTMNPACFARAAVEGLLCLLADGLGALETLGVEVNRIFLIGGGAQSEAVRQIAPAVFGREVLVPPAGEYVADGAARQAAWVASGAAAAPVWEREGTVAYDAPAVPQIREHYAEVRPMTWDRPHA
ncbi:MAG: xylulose kinase [Propionibacteriaceae bacterium]|jgi:xylulokinase|nr:xylulose kinase [Propionibacteriaceae bacterium]